MIDDITEVTPSRREAGIGAPMKVSDADDSSRFAPSCKKVIIFGLKVLIALFIILPVTAVLLAFRPTGDLLVRSTSSGVLASWCS